MPTAGEAPLQVEADGATLEMLVAALERQHRTTRALLRLIRDLAGPSARSGSRRRVRVEAEPRGVLSKALPLPVVPDEPPGPPDASLLQVRCFGRFEVLRAGAPVQAWRRAKAKTLFKYLVSSAQPVSRDALLDLLWPDADPRAAVNGLRVALHALRQALGPCGVVGSARDFVVFDGGYYSLNPEARLWVDVDEFAAHFAAGRRLERQQPADAYLRYEQAEAVYRNDYLLEDLYEDWTLVRREELKDQYLMVLAKVADHCFNQGDYEGCIVRCHKIIQKDACREDAYQRLMRCYGRLGQRSQALHWYGLCAQTLRQELDVSPSEETRGLSERIASGRTV